MARSTHQQLTKQLATYEASCATYAAQILEQPPGSAERRSAIRRHQAVNRLRARVLQELRNLPPVA
jgi:hypothetical protein